MNEYCYIDINRIQLIHFLYSIIMALVSQVRVRLKPFTFLEQIANDMCYCFPQKLNPANPFNKIILQLILLQYTWKLMYCLLLTVLYMPLQQQKYQTCFNIPYCIIIIIFLNELMHFVSFTICKDWPSMFLMAIHVYMQISLVYSHCKIFIQLYKVTSLSRRDLDYSVQTKKGYFLSLLPQSDLIKLFHTFSIIILL